MSETHFAQVPQACIAPAWQQRVETSMSSPAPNDIDVEQLAEATDTDPSHWRVSVDSSGITTLTLRSATPSREECPQRIVWQCDIQRDVPPAEGRCHPTHVGRFRAVWVDYTPGWSMRIEARHRGLFSHGRNGAAHRLRISDSRHIEFCDTGMDFAEADTGEPFYWEVDSSDGIWRAVRRVLESWGTEGILMDI